nr:reverse transcriptase domain-containing protein [Tanacetum cinerariifolium]
MRTRSSSNLVGESSPNPTYSNLKHRNRRRSKQSFILKESPVDTIVDQRTMVELLCAPTEGYTEVIVVPPILAERFELKHRAARRWFEKELPHSILTWEDLVSKFINEFFPPSRTKNLRNEISNFQQWFDESFHEAWDRYKDLLRACPHHGFTKLHQLDTFYNALNPVDQDSLNSAAGGNLLERRTQDVLTIIENKSKVRNSQNKSIVSQVKSSDGNSSSSFEIAKLTHTVNQQTSVVTTAMTAILKQFQATPPPAFVKADEEICVTCGGAHPYYQSAVNYNQGNFGYRPPGLLLRNTIANPKGKLKAITTRSGLVLDGPYVPMPPPFINSEEDERVNETLTDPKLSEFTIKVPPPLVQKAKPPSQRNYMMHQRDPLHPNIPYPLRMYKQKQHDKDEIQIYKFWKMLKQLHINITLADALILIPKYQKMFKALISNKEKLLELANTPLNKNCSAVILKKLPEKLGGPMKFLIPCGFSELKCKALADLGASFNLMPLSVWKKLGLPELISTRMTLELANQAICTPAGIVRDVFVLVGKFTFPADFIIVDYESDPRIPLILGRPFLLIARALFDVHREEMILRDDPNDNLFNSIPEMFTDEHTLYYSSPQLYDDYDDDPFELESETDDVYDNLFDSKEDKIKESKLLIDELDLPRLNKNVKKIAISHASLILEEFNPPLYELPFYKEVPWSETILSFSFKNEEKVFKPRILTSKGVYTSLHPELSYWGSKAFKVIKNFESPMEIFLCPFGEDIRILNVPCLHFYPS